MLGNGLVIHTGRASHDNAAGIRCGYVDAVVADACPRYYPRSGSSLQDRFRVRFGAGDRCGSALDFGRQLRLHEDAAACGRKTDGKPGRFEDFSVSARLLKENWLANKNRWRHPRVSSADC